MLDLSRVTLVVVATRAHPVTQIAINDCLGKADFGGVLIYTNDRSQIVVPGARYIDVPDWPTKKEAGRFYYQCAAAEIQTDFALMLEWDGGIYDPAKWRPEFFDYDYVGAPWNVRPGDTQDVGNGGFTLMSRRLAVFLLANPRQYPVTTDWDLCRVQRKGLEQVGFKWPDRKLAGDFSWELVTRSPDNFGYHGAFNWPTMLQREDLIERARLLTTTPYMLSKMADLVKAAPWLAKEIGEECWARYCQVNPAHARMVSTGQIDRVQVARMMGQQRRALHESMQRLGLKA